MNLLLESGHRGRVPVAPEKGIPCELDTAPLVSIGLPVFNGEEYIEWAVGSLLAQDYHNFELIISDNASTDATSSICLRFAHEDNRVRYYRTEEHFDAVWNFQRVLHLARGKYFMWAAHDDWAEASYVSKCVQELEIDPFAVLCYSLVERISVLDGISTTLDGCGTTAGLNRLERLHLTILKQSSTEIYGLHRREVLVNADLKRNAFGCDRVLLDELALVGHFLRVPEVLFHYRWQIKTADEYATVLGIKNRWGFPHCPKISECRALLKGIVMARIPFWQKPILLADTLYCYRRRYGGRIRNERNAMIGHIARLIRARLSLRGCGTRPRRE
jgi:glycosyltransferase involved in cell wall biosynthesis